MADGVPGETGENAVLLVELDSMSACAPAPILLRLMVERNVRDPTKKQRIVITAHAKVGLVLIIIEC